MTAAGIPGDPDPSVADRDLRSALRHAVRMAVVASSRRPPGPFPAALKRFASQRTLSAAALSAVRAAVVADPAFRRHLADTASADLVDETGRRWLAGAARPAAPAVPARPAGSGAGSASSRATGADATASELRVEQRRRAAAEAARDRADSALAAQRDRFAAERAVLQQRLADTDAARVRAERAATEAAARVAALEKQAVRHERSADAAAQAGQRASTRIAELEAALAAAESARTAALADRAQRVADELDRDRLRLALSAALEALGDEGASPTSSTRTGTSPRASSTPRSSKAAPRSTTRRDPIAMPGGRRADSPEGVEHLFRVSGVRVIVDGYNVAKLGWPSLDLEAQRRECIGALESLAARWGTSIIVVFDGADVRGASTRARRLVTVTFSAPGVLADDEIRDIVRREPPTRPLVVVTDDREIRDDVRAAGATPLSSGAVLAALR
ncbi:MAG: NYN domain-containing protein [Ilumatobacteraceae bacterium]